MVNNFRNRTSLETTFKIFTVAVQITTFLPKFCKHAINLFTWQLKMIIHWNNVHNQFRMADAFSCSKTLRENVIFTWVVRDHDICYSICLLFLTPSLSFHSHIDGNLLYLHSSAFSLKISTVIITLIIARYWIWNTEHTSCTNYLTRNHYSSKNK